MIEGEVETNHDPEEYQNIDPKRVEDNHFLIDGRIWKLRDPVNVDLRFATAKVNVQVS